MGAENIDGRLVVSDYDAPDHRTLFGQFADEVSKQLGGEVALNELCDDLEIPNSLEARKTLVAIVNLAIAEKNFKFLNWSDQQQLIEDDRTFPKYIIEKNFKPLMDFSFKDDAYNVETVIDHSSGERVVSKNAQMRHLIDSFRSSSNEQERGVILGHLKELFASIKDDPLLGYKGAHEQNQLLEANIRQNPNFRNGRPINPEEWKSVEIF